MWHMFTVLLVDTHLIYFYSITRLSHKATELRVRLRKPRVTPNVEKANGGHISVKQGDTVIETATGKVSKEEGTLEVLPLSYGCLVPTFIGALPFVCCLIEVPRMWTLAVHNMWLNFCWMVFCLL